MKINLPVASGDTTVDESAIRDRLFQIYIQAAAILEKADASAESKSALEKAKALARLEPVALQKAEKLLVLMEFLTE
jgi:hypothetical protein